MKTATIRDLRYDFSRIEQWLKLGEEVEITRHSQPVGRLSPPVKAGRAKRMPLPDFAARRRRIWGERVFSDAEVEAMRAFETGEP